MAISVENRKIFSPLVLAAPWNWVSMPSQKTRMMELPGRHRSLRYLQPSG